MKSDDTFVINPHIDTERALTYDLTYKGHISPTWSYTSSLYYNHVTDAIMAHRVGTNQDGGYILKIVTAAKLTTLALI